MTSPPVTSAMAAMRSAGTVTDPFSHWEMSPCVAGEPAFVSAAANSAWLTPLVLRKVGMSMTMNISPAVATLQQRGYSYPTSGVISLAGMGKPHARNITDADREAAERLKRIWLAIPRSERPTQQALADAWDGDGEANQSLISQYMNGRIALNYRAVLFFARKLGCSPADIRDDLPEQVMVSTDWDDELARKMRPDDPSVMDQVAKYGATFSRRAANETPAGYVRFQLMEGAGGMGQGVVNQDYPEVIRHVEVAEWEVRRKIGYLPEPGRIALITGRGPSMRPQIDHGDVVMVDTSVRAFDGDGVYVINLGGETQIKMLQVRGDGLYVVSANPAYPPYRVEHAEDLHIGGRVVSVLGIREL